MSKQLTISLLSVICLLFFSPIQAQETPAMTIAPMPYKVLGKTAKPDARHFLDAVTKSFQRHPDMLYITPDGTIVESALSEHDDIAANGQKYGTTHLFQVHFLGETIKRYTEDRYDRIKQATVKMGVVHATFEAEVRIYDVAKGVIYKSLKVKGTNSESGAIAPGTEAAFSNDGVTYSGRKKSKAEIEREMKAFERQFQSINRRVVGKAVRQAVQDWTIQLRKAFQVEIKITDVAKGSEKKVKKVYVNNAQKADLRRYDMLDVFIRKSYNVAGQETIREQKLGTLRVMEIEGEHALCTIYEGRKDIQEQLLKKEVIYCKFQ